eukprot:392227_1
MALHNTNSNVNTTPCEEECYENKKEIAFWVCFGAVLTLSGVFILLSNAPAIKQYSRQLNPEQCHLTHSKQINCSFTANCSCAQPYIYEATIPSLCPSNHTFTSKTQCTEYELPHTVPCIVSHCNATSFEWIRNNEDIENVMLSFVGGCLIIICGCCTYPCVLWLEKKRRVHEPPPEKYKKKDESSVRSRRAHHGMRAVVELPVLHELDEEECEEGEDAMFMM